MKKKPCGHKSQKRSGETEGLSKEKKGILITVEGIENIDPCKVKEITVRIEYCGNVLADSEPISVSSGRTDIGLEGFISAEDTTPQLLADLLANPALFTVTSGSGATNESTSPPSQSSKVDNPKKKQLKSAGSTLTASQGTTNTILGMCNLDMGGLLTGKKAIRRTLTVDPCVKFGPEEIVPWIKVPRLVVVATSGEEPLVPESMNNFNIVGVTVECVYDILETIKPGTVFDAKIPMPILGEKDNVLVFPGGMTAPTKEFCCKKKWLSLLHLEGKPGRSEHSITLNACDVINTVPELNLEKRFSEPTAVIQWNTWKSSLMFKSDCNYFYSQIMKYNTWPVDVCVSGKSTATANAQKSAKSDKKSKPTTSTAAPSTDHFTAFLDVCPLIYPGVTKVRVAAPLYNYSASDLVNKFGTDFSRSFSQSSIGNVKSKSGPERSKASVRDAEESKDEPGVPVVNQEGYHMFIIVEVELFKPLTPKKDPEYLYKELRSHVSLKGKTKRKETSLIAARENYSHSVKKMVSILATEYENFCLHLKQKARQPENFEAAFHEYLCLQESFHKIKATLEGKTLHLINEKFGALSQYNEKMPEIYIYLVGEMHRATNGCLLGVRDSPTSQFNPNEMQLYSEEAMEQAEYSLANKYLMLKLSRHVANPDYWLDLAVFFIRTNGYEAALEAVREALSLNPGHQIGLLMYGLLMNRFKDGAVAELAFHVLLAKYPDFAEGWTILRLFYTTLNNREGAHVARQIALQIEHRRKLGGNAQDAEMAEAPPEDFYVKTYPPEDKFACSGEGKYGVASFNNGRSVTDDLSWSISLCPPDNINIKTVILLLKLGFYEYAFMCLSEERMREADVTPPQYLYYQAVTYYLQGQYEDAIPLLESFVKEYGKDCLIWSLMGHCLYKLENNVNAIACYEYVMESYNRPDDLHLIFLRMGFYYLSAKKYSCAKKVFLIACKYSPSPKLWKGAGMACLRMEQPEDAEVAFSEASCLDHRDPEIWAYLALTNLSLGRIRLFQHCYSEAKKRNLKNQELIDEIEACIVSNRLEDEEC